MLVQAGQDDVRDFKNQVAGAAIADCATMHRTEAVENRKANPQQRDAEAFAGLPAVAVRDQQIRFGRRSAVLQILKVADNDASGRDGGKQRRIRC